ncbi:MAG: hypothetical protein IT243_05105 [Bacteroidia bacterium]|nr:hypothetical protein [Bacteroidia bacterium]
MKTLKFITLAIILGISNLSFSQIVVKVKPVKHKHKHIVCAVPKTKVVTYTTIKPHYRYVKGHWTMVHGRKVWVKAHYVRF